MKKDYFQHKGIVIQNDDPLKMGRVKVYIPEKNSALFKDWNNKKDTDKLITSLGKNLKSVLTGDVLMRLKENLPWAQIKYPIIGVSTNGFYSAQNDYNEIGNCSMQSEQQTTINQSDSEENVTEQNKVNGLIYPPTVIDKKQKYKSGGGSDLYTLLPSDKKPEELINYQINSNNFDSKACFNYGIDKTWNNDVCGNNIQSEIDYLPIITCNSNGNKVKGTIGIPGIGAIVSVYFDNGDAQYPIIDGCFYSGEQIKQLFDLV